MFWKKETIDLSVLHLSSNIQYIIIVLNECPIQN